MSFLKNLKNKFNQFVDIIDKSLLKLQNFISSKFVKPINAEVVQIYHHKEFSYVFISTDKLNLLSEKELNIILNYISSSIRLHLNANDSILINIITQLKLKDNIDINYTHSLTYGLLFNLKSLPNWIAMVNSGIHDILSLYKDSQLLKIELRFDYITSEGFLKKSSYATDSPEEL